MTKVIGISLGVVVLLGLIVAWWSFHWSECRGVGYSVLYCILDSDR